MKDIPSQFGKNHKVLRLVDRNSYAALYSTGVVEEGVYVVQGCEVHRLRLSNAVLHGKTFEPWVYLAGNNDFGCYAWSYFPSELAAAKAKMSSFADKPLKSILDVVPESPKTGEVMAF